MAEQILPQKTDAEIVLDVRPDLESGGEPFVSIMEAATGLLPDQTLVIIAPFEPVPLYDVLGTRGFTHTTTMVTVEEWRVRFTRS